MARRVRYRLLDEVMELSPSPIKWIVLHKMYLVAVMDWC